ncbi:biopolymer transporter ExbD [Campylobacter canadensis]|uniref:Biopolymer transporter ExbD n=1 Tax=Campylobacter canadensis TaxID=449520 RepID=A0ABS7WRH6_9BACT|nr:biopolymer transporter ExbD [Campylobacter canadensis]MBZ7987361.1 biopolymer transporter ExbD [Campylobacter canadensis]MBZ7994756.1 biopolymer transporter ExbD [Campylobacter canadensis]MBZ7996536.1 biopolymer transporter ExbD [Campylobacter canadensis]MBZ7998468.1 biopolymer transporter ExbD [Campylobacter canadensis]MBZ8000182.1 biopolymer transporter ExbD [Campylobacter canadensis]
MNDNDFLNSTPELNITPLVDVMLVLLVIFMLIFPSIRYDENINIPDGSKQNPTKALKGDIFVSISNNEITINSTKYNFNSFFDNFILNINKFDKSKVVYISGDKNISYEKLMQVLSVFAKSGFTKISLQTK